MAVDFFLKLEGIAGESQNVKHKGEIDVLSFSFGETNSGSAAHGGPGKVSMQDFHFTMKTNKASPTLFLKGSTGGHIKNAVLTASRPDREGRAQEFLKVTLENVLVSSFQISGNQGTDPSDAVSLNFAKIQMEFQPQGPAGPVGSPVIGGFDLKQNVKL